tara:strand:+ start:1309 stop:1710 length:402 start_codon:yes stop_codon:yes gene_type:complete
MKKQEIISLLKEEYDNRIKMFVKEVSTEYLKSDTKLKAIDGSLWTVESDGVVLNSDNKECFLLKKVSEDSEIDLNVNEKSDHKIGKNIFPRTNKDKVSVNIDIKKKIPNIDSYLLQNNEYMVPIDVVEKMFTL